MGRVKKLLLVSIVLTMGVVLAWPFRKTAALAPTQAALSQQPSQATDFVHSIEQPSGNKHIVAKMTGLSYPEDQASELQASELQASELQASVSQASEPPVTSPSDLEGHPAFRNFAAVKPPRVPSRYQADLTVGTGTVGPPRRVNFDATARPAYAMIDKNYASSVEQPEQPRLRTDVVHIVSNGDTLERLAERYLRNQGRALEIFDMNRDRLANPHLLPIGVELRIPPHPSRSLD